MANTAREEAENMPRLSFAELAAQGLCSPLFQMQSCMERMETRKAETVRRV